MYTQKIILDNISFLFYYVRLPSQDILNIHVVYSAYNYFSQCLLINCK